MDALDGGSEMGTLEVGEVVEVVEQQETPGGAVHARVLLARDGTAAWVTMRGPSGGEAFEVSLSAASQVESIAMYIEALCARCGELAMQTEQKAGECAASVQHPSLADMRSKLLQLKMSVNVHRMKMEQLRKRVTAAKEVVLQQWEMNKQRSQDGRCKLLVEKSVKDAATAVDTAEAQANKLVEDARANSAILQSEDGVSQVGEVKRAVEAASKTCAEAKAVSERFMESQEASKGSNRSLILHIRVELMKLTSRIATMEKKCRIVAESLW